MAAQQVLDSLSPPFFRKFSSGAVLYALGALGGADMKSSQMDISTERVALVLHMHYLCY